MWVFKMKRSEIVKAANVVGKKCVCICFRKKVHRFHEYNLLHLIMIIRTIFSSLHVENELLLLHHRLFIVLKKGRGDRKEKKIEKGKFPYLIYVWCIYACIPFTQHREMNFWCRMFEALSFAKWRYIFA